MEKECNSSSFGEKKESSNIKFILVLFKYFDGKRFATKGDFMW